MVENCRDFFSHPKENEGSQLIDHSLKTAKCAEFLTDSLGLGEQAFYAGLLHDLGKLNPYYQILFSSEPEIREKLRLQVQGKYVRAHAFFSALSAYRLIQISGWSTKSKMEILFSIGGHHSRMVQFGKNMGIRDRPYYSESLEGTLDNLKRFSEKARKVEGFRELNWDKCLQQFRNIPALEHYSSENESVHDYLDFCSIFSALIQADRGSFFDWSLPNYTIEFETKVLKRDGPLSELRDAFQNKVLSENSFKESIMVLEAPTGIGKTKIFLDIVNRCSKQMKIKRVFYFSPLLALTEDFEGKLFNAKNMDKSIVKFEDAEKVLVYNHTFTGSLLRKSKSEIEDLYAEESNFFKTKEYFEIESFNKELIITTTQRLLMILYSNAPADKMKLISFKESLLIIDEVQTIPKFLLPNLIELLKLLAETYDSKILLVSATIPEQLKNGLKMLSFPKDISSNYLKRTSKKIEYIQKLEPSKIKCGADKVLFIANTKKKARQIYEAISESANTPLYISTGISKRERRSIMAKLANPNAVTVVSTQVMEAGVDVSFDRIFREMAPLDNIIQAMGRLNREGEASVLPTLSVFNLDDGYKPYSELEVKISKQIVSEVKSSEELYAMLPKYYQQVDIRNLRNKNLACELESNMARLEFDEVWDFIKNNVLPIDIGDSVLIPHPQEWNEVKQHFVSKSIERKGSLYRQYANLLAELPKAIEDLPLGDLLDQELMEMGVFLPKKDAIGQIYDAKIGLDKWVEPK